MLDKDSRNEGRPSPSFQELLSGRQSLCNQLPLLPTSSLIRSVSICICFISNPKARSEICFWQELSCEQGLSCGPHASHPEPLMGGRGGGEGAGRPVTFLVLSPPSNGLIPGLSVTCPQALPVCFLMSYLFIIITSIYFAKSCGFFSSCFSLISVLLNEMQWGYWCILLSR